MFGKICMKTGKLTALLLAVLLICAMVPAMGETMTADTLFGVINGDTYENSFIGLGCTLEGWRYYTDEEMAEANQKTKEALFSELDESQITYFAVMMAVKPNNMQNVNIQLQNVKDYVSYYKTVGLSYMASYLFGEYKSMLESAGYTDIHLEVGEMSIGERTYTCIIGDYSLRGMHMYVKQLWDLRGDYMVNVTVTTVMEDKTDEVFSKFYPI